MANNQLELGYYERGQRRKLVLLVLLLLMLAALAYATYYFSQNKRLPIPGVQAAELVQPPTFLYAITGERASVLPKPTGIAVSKDKRVFVALPTLSTIRVFTTDGKYLFSFDKISDGDKKKLANPVHIAISPKNELYVADRDNRAVYVFKLDGTFVRTFDAGDIKWAPLAIAFDKDGYLYVSDVRDTNKHRVFVFDPSGKQSAVFGQTSQVRDMSQDPGSFYFPNGFALDNAGNVFVADGNNRRVQVFDRKGTFKRFLKTSGVPRGLSADEKGRVYVVDAVGHMIDVYSPEGESIVQFGGSGVGPGQFRFPNDIALDDNGRMYITDRDNNQVQVWGWPKAALPTPAVPDEPAQWAWLLLPLALLALLPLLRRRTMVAMPDFVEAMVVADRVNAMQRRRWRWAMPEAEHAAFVGRTHGAINLGELLNPESHSVSDVSDLKERLGLGEEQAVILSIAKRAKVLFTEDDELRRLSALLGIDAYDREAFLAKYTKGR